MDLIPWRAVFETVGISGVVILLLALILREIRRPTQGLPEVIAALQHQITEHKREIIELRAERDADRERIESLERQLVLQQAIHYDAPVAMWFKDSDLRMRELNKTYEDTFLVPLGLHAPDYIGRSDAEFWGIVAKKTSQPDISSAEFEKNDRHVLRTRRRWEGIEPVISRAGTINYAIIKWPLFVGEYIAGVAGMAIPEDLFIKIQATNIKSVDRFTST